MMMMMMTTTMMGGIVLINVTMSLFRQTIVAVEKK
jgi:hypothetical protein